MLSRKTHAIVVENDGCVDITAKVFSICLSLLFSGEIYELV